MAAVSRFGEADRTRRDRGERPRRGSRERDNGTPSKAAPRGIGLRSGMRLADRWRPGGWADARSAGLPRQRPSAGAGPRRAALISDMIEHAEDDQGGEARA